MESSRGDAFCKHIVKRIIDEMDPEYPVKCAKLAAHEEFATHRDLTALYDVRWCAQCLVPYRNDRRPEGIVLCSTQHIAHTTCTELVTCGRAWCVAPKACTLCAAAKVCKRLLCAQCGQIGCLSCVIPCRTCEKKVCKSHTYGNRCDACYFELLVEQRRLLRHMESRHRGVARECAECRDAVAALADE